MYNKDLFQLFINQMGSACHCFKNRAEPQKKEVSNIEPTNQKLPMEQLNNPYLQIPANQKKVNESNLLGTDHSKSAKPLTSRVNIDLSHLQEDRVRNSKISVSKMKPVSRMEWEYEKNGSKITVKKEQVHAGEKSNLVNGIPPEELKNKLVKPFAIKVQVNKKELVRNSNYLDDSSGGLDDLVPTADPSLANFSVEDIRTMQVPMVKTFLYDRLLTDRLIE